MWGAEHFDTSMLEAWDRNDILHTAFTKNVFLKLLSAAGLMNPASSSTKSKLLLCLKVRDVNSRDYGRFIRFRMTINENNDNFSTRGV